MSRSRLTKDQIAGYVEMFFDGHSQGEIAKLAGVSQATVSLWCKKETRKQRQTHLPDISQAKIHPDVKVEYTSEAFL